MKKERPKRGKYGAGKPQGVSLFQKKEEI